MKKPKSKKKAAKPASKAKKTSASAIGFVPAGDRVLVRPLSPEESGKTTSFGIIIPDTAKEKPEQGLVVAVGPGKRSEEGKVIPVSAKVGDKIMFSKYGFDEIKIAGKEYYIVNEQNILGILN
jgi:chaperonin GroES